MKPNNIIYVHKNNGTIYKTTKNRGEFNKVYKEHLTKRGKIRCSFCKYHSGENNKNKWYGGVFTNICDLSNIKYPNWKLVSKNRKQWMNKKIKFVVKKSRVRNYLYYEIKFDKEYH